LNPLNYCPLQEKIQKIPPSQLAGDKQFLNHQKGLQDSKQITSFPKIQTKIRI